MEPLVSSIIHINQHNSTIFKIILHFFVELCRIAFLLPISFFLGIVYEKLDLVSCGFYLN